VLLVPVALGVGACASAKPRRGRRNGMAQGFETRCSQRGTSPG